MLLNELLNHQRELNSHLTQAPSPQQLLTAIIAETGELLNETKAQWAWWRRNDKAFRTDQFKVQEELADILCFLLTGVLQRKDEALNEGVRGWWQPSEAKLHLPTSELCALLIGGCLSGFYLHSITSTFPALCLSVSCAQSEVEATYLQKVLINKARWDRSTELHWPEHCALAFHL